MDQPVLLSVRVGRVAPLGPDGLPSGYVKREVAGAVAAGPLGLAGDEQADLSVHGGPDKAVYGYPAAHYAGWAADFPELADRLAVGAMGENLSLGGLVEGDLCVGDVHAVGTARLQVCQPRQPCFKLALHLGEKRAGKAMVRSGRSGWYYRVVTPGTLRAGDAVALADRPNPCFRFDRLVAIVNGARATRPELEDMAAMAALPEAVRERARRASKG